MFLDHLVKCLLAGYHVKQQCHRKRYDQLFRIGQFERFCEDKYIDRGNVTSNHSIIATFAVALSSTKYNITASAGSNGSISPQGNVTVSPGGNQTFTIKPRSFSYQISDVKVDGVSKGPLTSYTFTNVTSNHSINATFARKRRWF